MKKFILCVVAGYGLVFTLFIGLPQMMGGRGSSFGPKADSGAAVSELNQPKETTGETQAAIPVIQERQVTQPMKEDKPLERYETGPVETFYRNGTLSSEWILNPEGGGVFKTYTPKGRPWMIMPFVGQVLEGELKTFYPEGPLFSRENYLAGERKGSFFWQYQNGNPWLEMTWNAEGPAVLSALYSEDGKPVGVPAVRTENNAGYFKAFDEHGHEVINMQHVEGEQKLVLKSYYQSGNLSAEVGLKGKVLHGRMIRYYPKGTVWMETDFSEGLPLQNTAVYLENQELLFAETLLIEPQSGVEWQTYYPGGEPFWQLTKLMNQGRVSVFQLTPHWQDETSAEAKKERTLL